MLPNFAKAKYLREHEVGGGGDVRDANGQVWLARAHALSELQNVFALEALQVRVVSVAQEERLVLNWHKRFAGLRHVKS